MQEWITNKKTELKYIKFFNDTGVFFGGMGLVCLFFWQYLGLNSGSHAS
jgi:hypothetical protein